MNAHTGQDQQLTWGPDCPECGSSETTDTGTALTEDRRVVRTYECRSCHIPFATKPDSAS